MSKATSCGILLYREPFEVFLVKPGGPYNKKAPFSIPKGHLEEFDKSNVDAAIREFLEETGANIIIDKDKLIDLGKVLQNKNKTVFIYAYKYDLGNNFIVNSNLIKVEFPHKSGKFIIVPEIDAGRYFSYEEAKEKMLPSQIEFIERLKNEQTI